MLLVVVNLLQTDLEYQAYLIGSQLTRVVTEDIPSMENPDLVVKQEKDIKQEGKRIVLGAWSEQKNLPDNYSAA
ncbi:hypothetical protein T265_10501 [Opisthorchis viverrini]|uniref:Uncharacterized protein n=1 Tax=Opisthorchis viverrini TaxID=6198 RepID=A0A074ZD12_OPIVI|nr:hypothetical protein T265_10501 [Opisthorchis viverrini]KER21085.1 hypothetical protein T265_10501 [Opisthorchis viverrini]